VATESFPLGTSALHPDWTEARFNVSGMFVYHPLVIQFMDIVGEAIDCRIPIAAMHGAPALPWNAGRLARTSFNPATLGEALQSLYDHNVGCFATFTNHLIEEKDLADPNCNALLDFIGHRSDLNGVIIVSDKLSAYIARKYPDLRKVASIIKVTIDRGRGRPDYYRELGKRFYRYMVHPDDCRDLRFLDQLDRDKAEIIVTENCAPNCPNREHHYDAYARWQKAYSLDPSVLTLDGISPAAERQFMDMEVNRIVANCPSSMDLTRLKKRQRTCNLLRSELKAIYDMGFRNFKMQGRADDPATYVYDLARFMLEPELVAPLVIKAMFPRIPKRSPSDPAPLKTLSSGLRTV